MQNKTPTKEFLTEHFELKNGILLNKIDRSSKARKGEMAGWIDEESGYQKLRLGGVKYMAHRLVWKMVHGVEPEVIDHIDGNRLNNRVENLRSVCHSENNKNKTKGVNNTSGMTGVSWHKRINKWAANIKINGKMKHLGYFDDFKQAVRIRQHEQEKLGFSFRHGV